jgi:hypothetical protein
MKILEKSRKLLRNIYMVLGAGAISLLFQACYGGPMDDMLDEEIQGQVVSKKSGEGINGIAIYVKDAYSGYLQSYDNGSFHLYLPRQEDKTYPIIFTDIDGEDNGGRFKQHSITLTPEDREAISAENPLIIELEEETGDEITVSL